MLGANDGAALRAGNLAITKPTEFTGEGLPDYWQAFDSLSTRPSSRRGRSADRA